LQDSYILVLAIGMLLVIITGNIDLSVGSVAAFVGAISAILMVDMKVHFIIALIISLVIGALVGAWQGFWIAYIKVPSFIVTLAGMLIFRGLTLVVLKGMSIAPFPVAFQKISAGFIPDLLNGTTYHNLTLLLGVFLSIILIFSELRNRNTQKKYNFEVLPKGIFIMNRTVIGRHIYALGGNEKAAKLSGVKTTRITFWVFVNMGVLSALSGLIFAARLNVATPKAGVGFELDAIAACFIGGASATGGIGTVIGAMVGGLVMGVMNNGMSLIGLGIDWQQAIKGMVLLLAVGIDLYSKNKNA
jgi:putative multiple sugar transport system permease protein